MIHLINSVAKHTGRILASYQLLRTPKRSGNAYPCYLFEWAYTCIFVPTHKQERPSMDDDWTPIYETKLSPSPRFSFFFSSQVFFTFILSKGKKAEKYNDWRKLHPNWICGLKKNSDLNFRKNSDAILNYSSYFRFSIFKKLILKVNFS